jgi:predicted DNA-binding transcriptional regulator YafY
VRASRLLSMLLLLQTRGQLTAPQLAEALGVSVRTVYRDIEALSLAGVPVYAERGPAGGYQLLEGYRTRLTGLTGDEADSLFLAGIPGPAAQLGLGALLAAAQLKVLAALPPELRTRAARVRERFYLDAPAWFQETEQTPFLEQVADAVWNQRRVRMRYQRWKGEVTRTVEPLGLVLKAGVWYLMARALDARDAGEATDATNAHESDSADLDQGRGYRIYRISRVQTVDVHPERFERPPDFEVADFWQAASRRFESTVYHAVAVVRLAPRALRRLPALLGPAVMPAVLDSVGTPDAYGWVQVTLPIDSLESLGDAVELLLRLGSEAEAIEPPELRERMARVVYALAQRYAPRTIPEQGGTASC